ncbi:MAG: FliI/YscN family ATPase [Phycisphaerales bacterium]
MNLFLPEHQALSHIEPMGIIGRVNAVKGLTLLANDFTVPIGSLVEVESPSQVASDSQPSGIFGEVVGFEQNKTVIMLLADTTGILPGSPVRLKQVFQAAPVSHRLLGRVVNGLGQPIDHLGAVDEVVNRPLNPVPISPMDRRRIDQPMRTGVRAIDLMTPLGRGQRLGIFAGPGVGKSTLLGQIARGTDADVNVIALIGERGREVLDFIHHSLGEEGLKRSVVIVATSDESPLLRIRAAKLASTTAEYFRDSGNDVMLMMDSVTRFAHAQRQVGLSVGEPPATKGYTPSVFSAMATLLERAGCVDLPNGENGSITGLYTILVEGDDMTEPISDAARGILDGHIVLSRKLAHKGHFPAIDVLDSVSRVAGDVSEPGHMAARMQMTKLIAAYREIEDLLQIGAYAAGSNPEADTAIDMIDVINELLMQRTDEQTPFKQACEMMIKLGLQSGEMIQQRKLIAQAAQPNQQ